MQNHYFAAGITFPRPVSYPARFLTLRAEGKYT